MSASSRKCDMQLHGCLARCSALTAAARLLRSMRRCTGHPLGQGTRRRAAGCALLHCAFPDRIFFSRVPDHPVDLQ